MDMMSRTLIRGMSNKDEGQYVGYFLPNKETLCRRRRDTNEGADQLCVYNLAQAGGRATRLTSRDAMLVCKHWDMKEMELQDL